MKITVFGTPAPQGSKRGFNHSKTGRVVLVESSKRVKPWRQDVKLAAIEARNGAPPLDGPLVFRMVFTVPKPKSAPKKKRTYPDKKPDLDKLLRSTFDALKEAGAIADDARFVDCSRLAKTYPNEDPEALDVPGVRIEIGRVEPTTGAEAWDRLHEARAESGRSASEFDAIRKRNGVRL